MAPLPSRKSLESMKRIDLQRLCKEYGVKANLKSEALINLLIDTAKPPVLTTPTHRSVPTRRSSRGGPSRISSIVVHDSGDEGAEKEENSIDVSDPSLSDAPGASSGDEPTPPLATRTRKGKEQTRLGVGRPVVAGGAGPRAVTRSLSVTKGKRGKGSRSLKPIETTIVEEEPEHHDSEPAPAPLPVPHKAPSQENPPLAREQLSPEASLESLATIDKHVADALRPLHEQMKSMRSELELMQVLKTEFGKLKTQISEMGNLKEKVESLAATVRDLRRETDEAASVRLGKSPDNDTIVMPSTPKAQSPSKQTHGGANGFGMPLPSLDTESRRNPNVVPASPTITTRHHPGITASILGKRHRDSTTSEVAVVAGSSRGAQNGTQPFRKRAKISTDDEDPVQSGSPHGSLAEEPQESSGSNYISRSSGFRVFSGLEVSPMELVDPPPPTESLPDFFASTSLGSEAPIIPRQGHPSTSTANATENQQPFAFSFQHAISSTPTHGMFMPSFPYPEPPQSPSPAGSNTIGFLNQHQAGRSDVFQAFGFPPPGRRASGLRGTSGLAGGFIDPAALTRTDDEFDERVARALEAATSTGTGFGNGEAAQMKRTMYGTELDGDTRFGDFGVEGVGNNSKGGFWAGARF
ncbi:hypothetical protein H0H87_011066 [Tephrocybe sp. NHM501043]|nr:hypothetical protein H0H87_011066 [Tephrocybe sp. NHM501043]